MDAVSIARQTLVGLSAILVSTYLYKYFVNVLPYWRTRGIKGPFPLPIIGNGFSLLFGNKYVQDLTWLKKYGSVYGVFRGSTPILVVADPEIARHISIKSFDHFQNHENGGFLNKYQKDGLIFLKGDRWRRIRNTLTPTFTSGKIRRMFKLMDRCADDLCDNMNEYVNNSKALDKSVEVNMKKFFGLYAMNAIASCCYGLKLERGSDGTNAARDQFVKAASKAFTPSTLRNIIAFTVPKVVLDWLDFDQRPVEFFDDIIKISERIVRERRKMTNPPDDYLQLLLNAKQNDEIELDDMDDAENHHTGSTNEELIADRKKLLKANGQNDASNHQSGNLTESEVVVSAMVFLIVGLETTTNLLTNCSYALSFHPEIQQKLYEEVSKLAEYNESKKSFEFDYDKITSCKYLDAVLSETLRLLPPATQFDRQCNEDYHLAKYNLDIKKGDLVMLNFRALMCDPSSWDAPEMFNPERFMPENRDKIVPGSYCPFGMGPRHCIGMRFSLTESKLGLAKLLMKHKFVAAEGVVFPPQPKYFFNLASIKNPMVKVMRRQ